MEHKCIDCPVKHSLETLKEELVSEIVNNSDCLTESSIVILSQKLDIIILECLQCREQLNKLTFLKLQDYVSSNKKSINA